MEPRRPPDRDDLDNPYAPPDSTFAEDRDRSPFGIIDFTVGDVFNWTWTLYRERLPICMVIIWGAFAIKIGASFLANMLLAGSAGAIRDQVSFAITQIAVTFGGYVVQFWIDAGMNLALLKIVRRQNVAFEDIFTGGRYVLTTILAWLVVMVCLAGPFVLAFFGIGAFFPMVQNDQSIATIVLVTAFVAILAVSAMYFMIRFWQFPFVVIDRNAGVFESLQTSWYLTRNQLSTMILVYLLTFTINLAGFLAFCAGMIFTIPLSHLLLAVTYQALTGQPPTPELQFLDSWEEEGPMLKDR